MFKLLFGSFRLDVASLRQVLRITTIFYVLFNDSGSIVFWDKYMFWFKDWETDLEAHTQF